MKKKLFVGLVALFMTLGLASCASDGKTPYIGENGNWWIGETDTGVPATGPAGQDGKDGTNGTDGEDGTSVTVTSVEKTGTDGLVDTYTITFSNGTTSTFTVTNGESNVIESIELTGSSELVDTYTITFTNGSTKTFTVTNGKDGENLTITSIELKSSEGLIDTYVINYSDGSKFEFVVSNGADGLTPYIGDNGNWWIGDTDTGVLADWEKANNVPLTFYSSGLTYSTMTLGGKSGYVVTGWDDDYFEQYVMYDLVASGMSYDDAEDYMDVLEDGIDTGHLVIPNYIGSVPVIGLWNEPKLNFEKVTLSRNTIYLGNRAFAGCDNLKEVDFNNCNITQIPREAFVGTSIANITLPSSVNVIQDYAFHDVVLNDFNFSNIKYIGSFAFDKLQVPFVYLSKEVKYVGTRAFYSTRVYLEHEAYPTDWPTEITTTEERNGRVPVNCKTNEEYLYSVNSEEVTVYQYLGTSKRITLPGLIEDKSVTKVGYGFGTPTYKTIELSNYSEINSYISLEEVVLPEGIKEIDDFALCGIGMTIFAPTSLERVSETLLAALVDVDDIVDIKINSESVWVLSNYLALAGSNMPLVIDATSHTVDDDLTREVVENEGYRIGFEIDYTKVEDDDNFYYVNEGTSYSILSYKGFKGEKLVIPSNYNDKPVLTILRSAIGYDSILKSIEIENGIARIRPFGVSCYDIQLLYIPASVLMINANGIYSNKNTMSIYVNAPSKPVDWDSNWTNVLANVIYGIDGEVHINNFFAYSIKNNQISLITYLGTSSNVLIPEEIDGISVKTIKTNFYKRTGGAEIYIPSSITTIESKAFVNASSKKFVIHSYAQEIPSGWDSNWYFNSYSSSSTSYVEKKWEETTLFDYKYNDEYAYSINDDKVTLISYCGNRSTVKIPRTIEGKNVDTIKAYCFYFDSKTSVYIPNEVTKIEQYGLELYSSSSTKSLEIYCEASSQPGGWNYFYAYNSYNSSTYYISTYFGRNIGY